MYAWSARCHDGSVAQAPDSRRQHTRRVTSTGTEHSFVPTSSSCQPTPPRPETRWIVRRSSRPSGPMCKKTRRVSRPTCQYLRVRGLEIFQLCSRLSTHPSFHPSPPRDSLDSPTYLRSVVAVDRVARCVKRLDVTVDRRVNT